MAPDQEPSLISIVFPREHIQLALSGFSLEGFLSDPPVSEFHPDNDLCGKTLEDTMRHIRCPALDSRLWMLTSIVGSPGVIVPRL